jgi:NADH-quinone oxidoreductase subunit M
MWLACLAALPLGVIAASFARLELERLRGVAVGAALALLAISALGALVLENFAVTILGSPAIRLDSLSRALVALPAALWVLAVVATPKTRLGLSGLRRAAVATLITLSTFLTESAGLLAFLWAASVAVLLAALSAEPRVRRVAALYLGGSTILFAAGVAAIALGSSPLEPLGIGLVVIAALVRKGIVPFHAWIPELFDRGKIGPSVLFSAPQTGAYVVAVLVVPRAGEATLRAVAVLALATAVYGAALAACQRDARRACGYLFVSQSALVMAGLDCTSEVALGGSLVLWISSALAFAGIARAVLVLEARRGRLDLSRHHGGYEQTPLLAVSFLVLGMACTGFPGTLGFIGQELLLEGAVEAFPILGFCVVAAGALTGVAVLRMYLSLFCGRPETGFRLGLLRRESFAFAALTAALIGTGVAPGLVVASSLRASENILQRRVLADASAANPRDHSHDVAQIVAARQHLEAVAAQEGFESGRVVLAKDQL